MNQHLKAFWALGWRMIVFTPLSLLGLVAFALILSLTFVPPLYTIIALIDGRYLLALLSMATWLLWLRFGACIRRLAFEGFEHGL